MSRGHTYPLVDLSLSRRLERAEAHASARFVEARARMSPDSGAAWIEVEGAYAMFDAVGSPITQTFGLGVFSHPTPQGFDTLEAFFETRGAAVFHEVSPLADAAALTLLNERRYRPCELTSVMFRPIDDGSDARARTDVVARLATADELDMWADVSARGWSEVPEVVEFVRGFARLAGTAADTYQFSAEIDGAMAATASLVMHGGVALLAGASTVPEARGRGAQRALVETRLGYAAAHGCSLAMICAAPGSVSQRNAERQGFRIAYTRIKWQKQAG